MPKARVHGNAPHRGAVGIRRCQRLRLWGAQLTTPTLHPWPTGCRWSKDTASRRCGSARGWRRGSSGRTAGCRWSKDTASSRRCWSARGKRREQKLVDGDIAFLAEPRGADGARPRLLAGVGPLVDGDVALLVAPPGADGARTPLLLAGIGPLVEKEQNSWMATSLFLLNRGVQMEQGHGFSPVWVRSWMATWLIWANRRRDSATA